MKKSGPFSAQKLDPNSRARFTVCFVEVVPSLEQSETGLRVESRCIDDSTNWTVSKPEWEHWPEAGHVNSLCGAVEC